MLLLALVTASLTVTAGPAPAQLQAFGVAVLPLFPSNVTVGAQNQAAAIQIANTSQGAPLNTQTVSVSNIRLHPSCSTTSTSGCATPEARPNPALPIFDIEPPGVVTTDPPGPAVTGRAGTSCAGVAFAISAPSANGTVTFAPSAPVVLGPSNGAGPAPASCIIDFTFDVLQRPFDGTTAVALANATTAGAPSINNSGISNIAVAPASTSITTQASPQTLVEGQSFSDTASVSGVPFGPPLTGTVTFRLYRNPLSTPPVFPTCTVPLAVSPPVPVLASSGPYLATPPRATATYTPAPPPGPGLYVFVATYDGDVSYGPATGACNDPLEQVTVRPPLPSIAVQMTANPTSVAEPGGPVTFTVQVTNTGSRDVTLTGLTDNVYGNLNGRGTCAVAAPGSVPPTSPLLTANGGSYTCSFTGQVPATGAGVPGQTQTNVVTATGTDVNGNTATANDDAAVTVIGTAPVITVIKDASPLTRPEPGGTFTFTVRVRNDSAFEAVSITTLTDNIYGNIATRPGSTCGVLVGTVLAPGATSSPCTFTGDFFGNAGITQTDVVTAVAVDNDSQTATDSDDATIGLTDVLPTVRVVKTATPTSLPVPGGTFTFTVVVTNTSFEPVSIISLVDNVYGSLSGRGTCAVGTTLAANGGTYTCSFSGTFTGASGSFQTDVVVVSVRDDEGNVATGNDDATVSITGGTGVRYFPISPTRIEDTRTGAGGLFGPLGQGVTAEVQITGRAGIPAGATAVVLNVTVTQPTAESYLTLFPSGTPRPLAANVNFTPGETVPNLAVVKVGAAGRVAMFNAVGSTHVVLDVAGYYFDSGSNFGRYQPLVPARIADTRLGVGGVRLGPGQSFDLQVTGQGGAPATGVSAAVLNVAVTNTTAESYLTLYPTGETRPLAANLNFTASDTVSNRTMTKLSPSGRVTIYNNAGSTDVIVDVGGTYTDASVAGTLGAYAPLDPARILDTRGSGGAAPIPAGGSIEVQVTGRGGVPSTGVRAVILNVAVTQPAGPGFLTIFPTGAARPLASDLNYATGETRSNLVVVQVGANGRVSLYTSAQAHVVVDVAGWFS